MVKKNKPTELVLPTDYGLVELRSGRAVISRDFFATMCLSQLNAVWAAITIKYCPQFEKCTVLPGTGIV